MARSAVDHEAAAASRRWLFSRVVVYGLLGIFLVIYILPLAIIVLNSFRTQPEISANGLIALPRSFRLDAWPVAWSTYCLGVGCDGVARFFWNSMWMTVPATIVSTLFGAVNGYILSKWRFPGSEVIFICILLGVFMPGQAVLLPWAYVLHALGLTNTITGLALVHCVQGLGFTTLFCRNYYLSVPDDLIKAARIDGAGFWRIFFKIILPISPPILIVTVIWQFTGIWNEYLFAVVLNSGSAQPITAAIAALSNNAFQARSYDVMSATVLIGAAPPLLIYFFGGKYFVRGLTQGAVK